MTRTSEYRSAWEAINMLPTYSLQFPTGTECLIFRTRIRSYGSSKPLTPKSRALVDCGTLTELVSGVFAEKMGLTSLDIEGLSSI